MRVHDSQAYRKMVIKTSLFRKVHCDTKPPFRAPWMADDAVVGKEKARLDIVKDWTSLSTPELLTMAFRIFAESSFLFPDDSIAQGTQMN